MSSKIPAVLFLTTIVIASVATSILPANALTTRDFTYLNDNHLTARYGETAVCGDHMCAPGEWDKLQASLTAAQLGYQGGRNAPQISIQGTTTTKVPASVCQPIKTLLSSAGLPNITITRVLTDLGCMPQSSCPPDVPLPNNAQCNVDKNGNIWMYLPPQYFNPNEISNHTDLTLQQAQYFRDLNFIRLYDTINNLPKDQVANETAQSGLLNEVKKAMYQTDGGQFHYALYTLNELSKDSSGLINDDNAKQKVMALVNNVIKMVREAADPGAFPIMNHPLSIPLPLPHVPQPSPIPVQPKMVP